MGLSGLWAGKKGRQMRGFGYPKLTALLRSPPEAYPEPSTLHEAAACRGPSWRDGKTGSAETEQSPRCPANMSSVYRVSGVCVGLGFNAWV